MIIRDALSSDFDDILQLNAESVQFTHRRLTTE
jgi:hypothetical protein